MIGKFDKTDKETFGFSPTNCRPVVNAFTKFMKFTHNAKNLRENNKTFFLFDKWKMIITVIS